jgi:HEAT repeat protein
MPSEVLLNHRVNAIAAVVLSGVILLPAVGLAQAAGSREALLAEGWSALAGGRAADATRAAAQIFKTAPGDHDAASLAIAAALTGPNAMPALDAYERWLQASQREDASLLEKIAVGFLRRLSDSGETRISYAALAALARHGDADARTQLGTLVDNPALGVEAETALAAAGIAAGVDRLRDRIAAGGRPGTGQAIEALKNSGHESAAGAIAIALKDPSPPSRIAAAYALADLGATAAIPQLKQAAADPEPSVRAAVELALGLLGDPEGLAAVAALANSPLADYRLLGAKQAAKQNPQGAWVAKAEALLSDPDPSVRVHAAELLIAHGHPLLAQPVLSASLNSPSAPLRTLAAASLGRVRPQEASLPTIRRMLRDALADVRLAGARALLIFR